MLDDIHAFSAALKDVIDIVVNLHLMALVFVNLTKSPDPSSPKPVSAVDTSKLYRLVEIFAGLVTPAAKK